MKQPLLSVLTLAGSALFALTPAVHADQPVDAARRAEVVALLHDPRLARVACAEMMKNRAQKRVMARVAAQDPEFRRFYVAEVGSDAPHEERNPSDHPELFGARKR